MISDKLIKIFCIIFIALLALSMIPHATECRNLHPNDPISQEMCIHMLIMKETIL